MRALEKRREDEKKGASKVLESASSRNMAPLKPRASLKRKRTPLTWRRAPVVSRRASLKSRRAPLTGADPGGGEVRGPKPLAYRNDALGRQSADAIKDL